MDTATRLVSSLLLELVGRPSIGEPAGNAYRMLISGEPGSGFVMFAGAPEAPHAVCTVLFVHAMRTLGRYAFIQEMYVEPEFRSTGVGRELMEAALAEAVAHGASIVELDRNYPLIARAATRLDLGTSSVLSLRQQPDARTRCRAWHRCRSVCR